MITRLEFYLYITIDFRRRDIMRLIVKGGNLVAILVLNGFVDGSVPSCKFIAILNFKPFRFKSG